jgi:hypothetical protein
MSHSIAVSPHRSNALAWWSAATILVSAFLLFQVQPVISKKILPWFGGSPAVWTTCVLFFQLVLLGGYAYAHVLTHSVQARWQGIVHLVIVILACVMLPIVPGTGWKPTDGDIPAMRILMLLTAVVGVPYFVLSTTGPLVQAWFARLYPGRSPYRLYSLSNIGSLAALLTYPFFVETTLRVDTQGYVWSLAFVVFAALIGILALNLWRADKLELADSRPAPPVTAAEGLVAKRPGSYSSAGSYTSPGPKKPDPDAPPRVGLRLSWLGLAALASLALLAITNHLCQDIAVVPFMWVIPLSLYLLSFIICFDNERWYLRKTFGAFTILMILWLTGVKEYSDVNSAMEYPQKFVRVLLEGPPAPPEHTDPDTEPPPRPTFNERVQQARPYYSSPFSRSSDAVFDGIGWVVKQVNDGLNYITRDRSQVKLESGETFASLDKNKDGKLVKEEVPDPPLTSLVQWDADSDGEVTESEFNRKAGKREPRFNLAFEVDTYDFKEHVFAAATAYMLALFGICMVCHGELVKSKPQPKYLTSFYLSISAGGALGGLFVALICPLIFKTHFELSIALVGSFVVAWLAIFNDGKESWLKGREALQWVLVIILALTTLVVMQGNREDIEVHRVAHLLPKSWQARLTKWKLLSAVDEDLIAIERNFYGTVTVSKMGNEEDDPLNAGKALYNGRIWHGFQFTDPSRELEPSTYYVTGTGAALAVQENPRRDQGLRVAVIGLGSGSMAAHARAGDVFKFYEIDPKVLKVAKEQFTYLTKSPAHPEVVMGDARLSLDREPDQNYDVIHLDAFSGDAIPAHLLTDEAFALYERHLRKDEETKMPIGIVVVHISNRYLNLEPVVAAIARKYDYDTLSVHKTEDGGPTDTASDWVIVTKDKEFLNKIRDRGIGEPLKPKTELLWTDQYTALYWIMKQ